MKSIRIQPIDETTVLVDVVCDCGNSGLRNLDTNSNEFKHVVKVGTKDFTIGCVGVNACGKQFLVHPQTNHVHISEIPKSSDEGEYTYSGD